jgi:hypothetical protein
MPTIPIPPLEENSPEQHAYFDAIKKRMELDDVPLVTRAMVYKLDTAIAHAKGMGVLMGSNGVLPGWFKEMLAVATSAVYACDY